MAFGNAVISVSGTAQVTAHDHVKVDAYVGSSLIEARDKSRVKASGHTTVRAKDPGVRIWLYQDSKFQPQVEANVEQVRSVPGSLMLHLMSFKALEDEWNNVEETEDVPTRGAVKAIKAKDATELLGRVRLWQEDHSTHKGLQ